MKVPTTLDQQERDFHFFLNQSRRYKRLSLSFSVTEQHFTIRAPHHIESAVIENFLKTSKEWALKQVKKLCESSQPPPQRILFNHGATFPLNGKPTRIECQTTNKRSASFEYMEGTIDHTSSSSIPAKLIVYVNDPYKCDYAVRYWLYQRLENFALQQSKVYADRLGQNVNSIKIKCVKSMWGSCSSQKNIMLNWRLILAPTFVQNYIIVHEVSHLVHMNHSKAFWSTVASLMPEYKIAEAWLKKNGKQLYLYGLQ